MNEEDNFHSTEEEVFPKNNDLDSDEEKDTALVNADESSEDPETFGEKLPKPERDPDALTKEDIEEMAYDCLGESMEKPIFRLRNKSLHLTYPQHIKPHDILNFINTMKKSADLVEYSIVQETSTSGHQHTHALLIFSAPFITKSPTKFDIGDIHPHIRKVTTTRHKSNIIRYHKKQGDPTSNMDVFSNLTYVEKIYACKTFREVCNKFVKAPSHIFGLKEIYKYKPASRAPSILTSEQLYHWQKEVEQYIQMESSKALWFYDKNIRSGKTAFAKYLRDKYNAFYYSIVDTDLAIDLARNSYNDEETDLSIVIIDVPKSKASGAGTHLYQQIEYFLDGELPPTKQNVFTTTIEVKKVIIMSKYAPDIYSVSHDKIEVNRIGSFNNEGKTDYRVITKYVLEGEADSSPDEEELVFPNVNVKKLKNRLHLNVY